MKPKIKLDNPLVQIGIMMLQKQAMVALDAPQKVESSIIPMYALPKTKAHQKPKTKPEQMGSGVLVRIVDNYFIFGATHVFLAYGEFPVITGVGNGSLVEFLGGERYSTGNKNSAIDIYDASVYHITSDMSDDLKRLAITLDDFDFSQPDSSVLPIYLSSGFRIKNSNVSGNQVKSRRECYPSIEIKENDYQVLNTDSKHFIALAYENQILLNDKWITSPIPRGFSGGAIMKAEGTNVKILNKPQNVKQLLTAILTEHHREKPGKPGILKGTRVNVHLSLIHNFLPGLLP
jgi:hypothetical protein